MWRELVSIGILFCAGVLGASNIIVSKKPNAKELIDKLVPYQGWLGIAMFLWGVWDVIDILQTLNVFSLFPIRFLVAVVAAATEVLLGFLLGFSLLSQWVLSKNEAALEKGQEIRGRLAKHQGPLGLVAIGLAIFNLLMVIRYA